MCSLPAAVKKVFHPIITCALTADLGAYALGVATGKGFENTLSKCSSLQSSVFEIDVVFFEVGQQYYNGFFNQIGECDALLLRN